MPGRATGRSPFPFLCVPLTGNEPERYRRRWHEGEWVVGMSRALVEARPEEPTTERTVVFEAFRRVLAPSPSDPPIVRPPRSEADIARDRARSAAAIALKWPLPNETPVFEQSMDAETYGEFLSAHVDPWLDELVELHPEHRERIERDREVLREARRRDALERKVRRCLDSRLLSAFRVLHARLGTRNTHRPVSRSPRSRRVVRRCRAGRGRKSAKPHRCSQRRLTGDGA